MTVAQGAGPDGPTIGELARGMEEIKRALADFARTMHELPKEISAELDARTVERLTAIRAEKDAAHEVIERRLTEIEDDITEQDHAHKDLDKVVIVLVDRVALLQRIVLGACGLVLVTVLTALLALIVLKP